MKFSDRLDELFYKDKKDRTKIETAIAKGYWSSMDIDTWNDALEELAKIMDVVKIAREIDKKFPLVMNNHGEIGRRLRLAIEEMDKMMDLSGE